MKQVLIPVFTALFATAAFAADPVVVSCKLTNTDIDTGKRNVEITTATYDPTTKAVTYVTTNNGVALPAEKGAAYQRISAAEIAADEDILAPFATDVLGLKLSDIAYADAMTLSKSDDGDLALISYSGKDGKVLKTGIIAGMGGAFPCE